MIMNGYQQYKQQSVDTMTSGEMLILLFDGAVRNVTSAGLALDRQDYDTFETAVEKTDKIIRYLSATLNMDYEISKDLYRLYDYFLYQLSRLRAGRNKEITQELRKMLMELRDTFKEADRIAANHGAAAGQNVAASGAAAK
ncbi:MAG: flagellar protein FliS [Anaerotignum sp.]|nr:flagellar protein FliS [Anaerotignum sp.]MCI8866660.1 flagellar protein FliS [Anaerotignum sp.]